MASLAEDGKVVCVRLTLLAEMMKGKPWQPAVLRELGGAEGLGARFLEETFVAQGADPRFRQHGPAARAVLKALLPLQGTDIKGHMRSRGELLEASGYGKHAARFDELLRILDGELRLVTPTDPEGLEATPAAGPSPPGGHDFYQLTHDYLVPSLREWLARKQRETRRGRAEIRLADRAESYNHVAGREFVPAGTLVSRRTLTEMAGLSETGTRTAGKYLAGIQFFNGTCHEHR